MGGQHDLIGSAVALAGAWGASIGTAITDGGALGAIAVAFSGALTMLYVGQRRQRLMLLESIEIARHDRDECRVELASLKQWVAENLERH